MKPGVVLDDGIPGAANRGFQFIAGSLLFGPDVTENTRQTYFYECWRSLAAGVLETAGQTFLLLIAVRVFAASPTAKALLASGYSLGLILSLFAVVAVTQGRWRPAQAAACLSVVAAVAFALPAAVPEVAVFVTCSLVGLASLAVMVPLLTQIYQDNYPAAERGRRFSRTIMIRVATAALFSELAGRFLSVDVQRYRWLLLAYALACAAAAFCLWRVPSKPLAQVASPHPLRALRFVREDRVFRITLICWMLLGFANLMMVPLRVEYLANARYGLTLSAATVALLIGVIPNIARLIMSPVWGWLFDRVNFFALRVTLNLGFALSILTFFTSDSFSGLVLGAVIYGISNAGGDVAWSLWVTKFAPPDRVADYMSVHTFFTGLRGLVAPLVAFHLVAGVSVAALGWLSAALIVIASLILAREIRVEKAADPGTELLKNATQPLRGGR